MTAPVVLDRPKLDAGISSDDCPFCTGGIDARIVDREGSIVAILDGFPVTEGHHLLIPSRHVATQLEFTQEENADLFRLLGRLTDQLQRDDSAITGFNIGSNCGPTAGQTVGHAHVHLIPRRVGDHENPRGGVRAVIPGKQNY